MERTNMALTKSRDYAGGHHLKLEQIARGWTAYMLLSAVMGGAEKINPNETFWTNAIVI